MVFFWFAVAQYFSGCLCGEQISVAWLRVKLKNLREREGGGGVREEKIGWGEGAMEASVNHEKGVAMYGVTNLPPSQVAEPHHRQYDSP